MSVEDPEMKNGEAEIQKYSVWIPIESAIEQPSVDLQSIIREYATKLNQPVFSPHVTVIGGLQHLNLTDILEIAEKLAAQVSPFYAFFHDLEIGSSFFQSLYFTFSPESASKLAALHNRFREEAYDRKGFGTGTAGTAAADYLPHVSVVYGVLPVNQKMTIAEEIRRSQLLIDLLRGIKPINTATTTITTTDDDDGNHDHNQSDLNKLNNNPRQRLLTLQNQKNDNSNTSSLFVHKRKGGFCVRRIVVMDTDLSQPISCWTPLRYFDLHDDDDDDDDGRS